MIISEWWQKSRIIGVDCLGEHDNKYQLPLAAPLIQADLPLGHSH
jgi:hypothetical protein